MTRRQAVLGGRLLLLLVALFVAGRLYGRFDETARGRIWRHSPATGHWYTLLRERLTWDDAQAIAQRLGGYLACIGDEREQAWLQKTLLNRNFQGAYLGLRAVPGGGAWAWVDGEPVSYTNWCPTYGHWDGDGPPEDHVVFMWGASHTNAFFWDVVWPDDGRVVSAVVERDRNPRSPLNPWLLGAFVLWLLAGWQAAVLLRELLWPPDDGWGGRLRQHDVRPEPARRPWTQRLRRMTVPLPVRWALAAALAVAGAWLLWTPELAPLNTWVERPDTGHWYQLAGPDLDWDGAEAAAERLGGHLAIIETGMENQWLVERLLNRPLYGAWLGFREIGERHRFVNVDGTVQAYANWAPGQPSFESKYPLMKGLIHGQWGVETTLLGRWTVRLLEDWWLPASFTEVADHALIERDTPPPLTQRPRLLGGWGLLLLALLVGLTGAAPLWAETRRRPWLVPAALAAGCAGAGTWLLMLQPAAAQYEWVRNPSTGHWYARMPLRDGWDAGVEEAMRCGAYLVILGDEAEHRWVCEQFLELDTFGAFIGLREVGREDEWRWVDGTPVGFTRWGPTAGDNDSLRAADVGHCYGRWYDNTHTWNDVPRDGALFREETRPEFALFERDTDPAAAPRCTTTAASLLLLLALAQALIAWHGSRDLFRRQRPWVSGLVATLTLVLAAVGAQPDPYGPTPRTTPPNAPPPTRPDAWPDQLARFTPPPPLTWADYRVSPIDGMPQVRIPAGVVFWGSPEGEGESDERQRGYRAIDSFWMDLHEVTWEQYARFLNSVLPTPERRRQWVLLAGEESGIHATALSRSRVHQLAGRYEVTEPRYARRPAICVTREGARAYAWWAGRRLPTEAEWERAARGDRINVRYVWGNEDPPPPGVVNLRDDSLRRELEPDGEPLGFDDGAASTTDVCSYAPGPFGLFDLAGNASEWCEDWYDPELHLREQHTDPVGVLMLERVVHRGGSYHDSLSDQRIARRFAEAMSWRGGNTGFRCVSSEDAPTEPDLAAVQPPEGWPAWLDTAGYVPPPLLNWHDYRISPIDGMPQVRVPITAFTRGTTYGERDHALSQLTQTGEVMTAERFEALEPAQEITCTPYWIDMHEVTVGQYRRFCAATGRALPPGMDQRSERQPIGNVAWEEAAAYAEWAGRELPTEAQWELAARGRSYGMLFPWGERWDPDRVAWGLPEPLPVGSRGYTGMGVFDMLGNVAEWCRDTFAVDAYRRTELGDPLFEEASPSRVHRGGSVDGPMMDLRSGARAWAPAQLRDPNRGFRCAAPAPGAVSRRPHYTAPRSP